MERLHITTVGLSVGIFLGISYLVDVSLWLLWPSLGTQKIWEALLPGFRWINPAQFVLGLVESFLLGFYVALIFVPVYNRRKSKA